MNWIDTSALARLNDYIAREIDQGRSTAAQFALARHGEVVATGAFGTASDSSTFLIFSATKPFVAMALVPHLASGEVDLLAPVSEYLDDFANNGKSDVLVLQVLTMQGGFPQVPIDPGRWTSARSRRDMYADWALAWPAGSQTEYHPMSAHCVIADIVEAVSGRPYTDVVNELSVACGGPALLGAPSTPPVEATVWGCLPADREVLSPLYGRLDLVPDATVGPGDLLLLNVPELQALGVPGGGGIASAAALASVYQGWLHNPDGVLPDAWRHDALTNVRNVSINVSDRVPANRTIVGVVSGRDGYSAHRWFPEGAPRSFGHSGAGGQLAWVDPDTGLSFAFVHDALHQNPGDDFVRCRDLNELALACIAGSR